MPSLASLAGLLGFALSIHATAISRDARCENDINNASCMKAYWRDHCSSHGRWWVTFTLICHDMLIAVVVKRPRITTSHRKSAHLDTGNALEQTLKWRSPRTESVDGNFRKHARTPSLVVAALRYLHFDMSSSAITNGPAWSLRVDASVLRYWMPVQVWNVPYCHARWFEEQFVAHRSIHLYWGAAEPTDSPCSHVQQKPDWNRLAIARSVRSFIWPSDLQRESLRQLLLETILLWFDAG
jgi:hypothetical protein